MAEKVEAKLKTAKEFKNAGNELYRKGDFKGASKKYYRAVLYLKGIDVDVHGGAPIPIMNGLGLEAIELTEELEQVLVFITDSLFNFLMLLDKDQLEEIRP